MFPVYANDIYVYDIEQGVMRRLRIPFDKIDGLYSKKHLRVISDEKNIYCISKFPCFVIVINKRSLEYYINRSEQIKESSVGWQYNVCFTPCINHKQIYIPTYNEDVLIYDIEARTFYKKQYKIKLHTLMNESVTDWIVGIYEIAGRMWAHSYDGYVYEMKLDSFNLTEGVPLTFEKRKVKKGRIPTYRSIVGDENGLYLFPQYDNYILHYNYSRYSVVFEDTWGEKDKIEYGKEIEWINGTVVMNNWYNGFFYVFDTVKKQLAKGKIKISIDALQNLNLRFQGVYITDAVELLMIQKKSEQKLVSDERNAGISIWECTR